MITRRIAVTAFMALLPIILILPLMAGCGDPRNDDIPKAHYRQSLRSELVSFPGPRGTPLPSLFVDIEVNDPPGNVIQPATPTPTATPTPPPTPTPTPIPVPPTPVPTEEYRAPAPVYTDDWVSAVCSMAWSCEEALYVIQHESGGNQWAVNASSGACGLFQLLPCPGMDIATQLAGAWAKYVDGGYSFARHWYVFWN